MVLFLDKIPNLNKFETFELEMRRLLEILAEELLIQKFPKKMKDTPKTIHFVDSLCIITKAQI